MGNLAFVMTNSIETATLYLTGEATGFPAENLVCRRQSKRFISTDTTATIIWDLGASAVYNSLTLLNHDCATTSNTLATLSFSNTSTSSWVSTTVTISSPDGVAPYDTLLSYNIATAYRYYKLEIVASGTGKVGELVQGSAYEMTEMYAYGQRNVRDPQSLVYQTDYGAIWAYSLADAKGDRYRRYFAFPHKTATGAGQYQTVMDFIDGGVRPLVLIEDYGDSDPVCRYVHVVSAYDLSRDAPAVYGYALETIDQARHGEIG